MPTKKLTVEIVEILKKPFEHENIPDFKMAEGSAVPLFENSLEQLNEFHKMAQYLMMSEDIVVFWGFTGLLMNKYSRIKQKGEPYITPQELEVRIQLTKSTQTATVYRDGAWTVVLEKLGKEATLSAIDYQTALLILEGKIKPPEEEYQEPDEDEFDENCLSTCLPGDHKCGK